MCAEKKREEKMNNLFEIPSNVARSTDAESLLDTALDSHQVAPQLRNIEIIRSYSSEDPSEFEIISTRDTTSTSPNRKQSMHRHVPSMGLEKSTSRAWDMELSWHNLMVSVENKNHSQPRRRILNGVSGRARPGQILAILGPSGCGKSTLLNVLSRRCSGSQVKQMVGEILLNGHPPSFAEYFDHAAYVTQQDVLMETMTPREALLFVADLRMYEKFSSKQRQAAVHRVLDALGLIHIADNTIGGTNLRGVSGGERKRVAIGLELVLNPYLIFVDEPTSSLDSSTAESVITSLRRLADQGRTVIISVHQPSSMMMKLFDQLLLLESGRCAYFGETDDVVAHFSKIGYDLPPQTNPAEWFLNVLDRQWKDDGEENADKRLQKIFAAARRASMDNTPKLFPWNYPSSKTRSSSALKTPPKPAFIHVPSGDRNTSSTNNVTKQMSEGHDKKDIVSSAKAYYSRLFHELMVVTVRTLKNYIRQPTLLRLRAFKALTTGIICGVLFFQLSNNQASIGDRGGAVFFIVMSLGMSASLETVRSMPLEHALYEKEILTLYSPSSYYIAKLATELPFLTMNVLVTATIAYFLVGFQLVFNKIIIFYFVAFLFSNTCDALGLAIGSSFSTPETAASFTSLILMPLVIFSGFLINTKSVPFLLAWIEHISPFRYALGAILLNEFDGLELDCTIENQKSICIQTGKEALMKVYELEGNELSEFILNQFLLYLSYRIIGYGLILYRYVKLKKLHHQQQLNPEDGEEFSGVGFSRSR